MSAHILCMMYSYTDKTLSNPPGVFPMALVTEQVKVSLCRSNGTATRERQKSDGIYFTSVVLRKERFITVGGRALNSVMASS